MFQILHLNCVKKDPSNDEIVEKEDSKFEKFHSILKLISIMNDMGYNFEFTANIFGNKFADVMFFTKNGPRSEFRFGKK